MVLNHVDNMCVSLEFHKNRRINLLVYEEVGIMENEKSILNPCKHVTAVYIHKWQTY